MAKTSVFIEDTFVSGFLSVLDQAETIALVSHTNPDGDALGSLLGLADVLRQNLPAKNIVVVGSDSHPVPRYLMFLSGATDVLAPEACKLSPDVLITLDVPNSERLNKAEPLLKRTQTVVMIDHHEPETPFADLSLICSHAAATSLVLLKLFEKVGFSISKEAATCLYCGLMTDTGRFQFQNTNAEVFKAADTLFCLGADPTYVASNIYEQDSFAQLKLRSLVLDRLEKTEDGRIAYSYLTNADLKKLNATKDDLASFVDDVRLLEGVSVAVFFRELANDNGIRVNLRAKGNSDVSKIARDFGGGGHKAAAGFTLNESLEKTIDKTLYALEMVLDS